MKNLRNLSKKAVAFLVSIAVLLSAVTVSFAVVAQTDDENSQISVWTGEIADSYAGGTGAETSPYLIENGEQLAKAVQDTESSGKYYKLTSDIYLNDVSDENWKESAQNWIWNNNVFAGNFDGDGHTVSGLYYNGDKSKVGLFCYTKDAVIQKLKISNAYIYSTGFATGAIVGDANSGALTVNQCYVDENSYVESTYNADNNKGAGGIVGYGGATVTVSNSAFLGTVKAPATYGTLLGNLWATGNTVTGSFSVQADKFLGKSGRTLSTNSQNNYGTGSTAENGVTLITAAQMIGADAKAYMPGLDWGRYWSVSEIGYPTMKILDPEGTVGEVWSGNTATKYAGGSGTSDDPYLISTGEQLARLTLDTDTEGKYYKLTDNIILNDTSLENWQDYALNWVCSASVTFKGTLDGNGYTVSGLYYKGSSNYVALFSNISGNAAFKNLFVENSSITTTGDGAGVFAAYIKSDTKAKFERCYIADTVDVTGREGVGGFIAYGMCQSASFDACASFAKVTATYRRAGSFIGNIWWGSSAPRTVSVNSCIAGSAYSDFYAGVDSSFNNSYCATNDTAGITSGIIGITALENMKGEAAKANMSGLDWVRTWKADENGGYPRPIISDPNGTVGEVWSGNTATKYAGGSGSEEDPYLISTAEQLARLVLDTDTAGKFYKITDDIIINDTSLENWQNYAINWVNTKNYFAGTLNGDGHTVSGLYYRGASNIFGLFYGTSGTATISRVVLEDVDINISGYGAGSLVGFISGGTVKIVECYVTDASVTSTYSADNNKGAGGFVGYGGGGVVIESSAYIGTVSAPGYPGAFIGNCWKSGSNYIKDSFTNAQVPFSTKCTITADSENNYGVDSTKAENGVEVITASEMLGTSARDNMPALDWGRTWKTDEDGGYPRPIFPDPNGTAGEVWTGNTAARYNGGSGTEEDPYQIATGEQLLKMVLDTESEGTYYKLTYDIKLNDTSADNWKDYARGWIWNSNVFKGHFDGEGHTISGLYYKGAKSKVGLFCYTTDAVIENVILEDVYIYSTGYGTGAIVGDANSGSLTLTKCYVRNAEIESTYDADANKGAGGLVGYGAANITVKGCAFIGTVKAPGLAGSILGNCWGKAEYGLSSHKITNTFSVAGIKFCTKQGLSSESDNNYSDCETAESYVTYIEAAKMSGADAKKNMSGLDWGRIWKTTESYPICNFSDEDIQDGNIWTGAVAEEYAGGSGTEDDPYLIANGEQLAKMVLDTESAGKFYKLIADIKLNDTSSEDWIYTARQWVYTTNVFQGTFNGDCYKITGLYYNGTKSKVGLFGYAKNAKIMRVVIDEAYLRSTGYAVGTFVGDANSGTVEVIECYADENVYVESTYNSDGNMGAGGIVGYGAAQITVDGCAFLGTVKAPNFAGAILGNCWGKDEYQQSALVVKNSFSSLDMKFCSKQGLSGNSVNNYSVSKESQNGVTVIALKNMKGKKAEQNMTLLNWYRSWKATEKGFPVLNVGEYEGVKGQAWSGRIAKNFAGGSGTEEDPYLIETPEQLAKILNNLPDAVGKYYKLTADIYLNDVSNKNWTENAVPWFWASAARQGNFNGHIDGDGHVVYGMYLEMEMTTSVVYTGLFPTISDGTVIEKLGLSDAYINITTDNTDWQSYVGGFTGLVFFNNSDEETDPNNLPVISQCFGSSSVELEGRFAGGIIAGGPRPANIDNCYFIGKVTGERVGGIIGNTWTSYEGATVTKCYSATAEADDFAEGKCGINNSATPINYTLNYANSSGLGGYVTQISLLMMRGKSAKVNMPALDFENIWYALENGTPVLKIFGTTDKFSNTSDPKPIEISFVSNGGTECSAVYGNPEDPLKLPIPEREGYTFGGWYVYKELDYPFEIDYFPYFDQVLYAKWIPDGIVQDFEDYTDSIYDKGYDYEYYKVGVVGYNAKYVRSGMASMHRIGAEDRESDFLIQYEDMLTVGKKYKMSFWITTDTDDTSVTLSLVHEDWPDVYDTDSGVEEITTVTSMRDGEWQKIEFTFIARTRWVAIRTSGLASVYFDDFMIIPVSDKIYPIEDIASEGDTSDDEAYENLWYSEDTESENKEELETENTEKSGKKVIKKIIRRVANGGEDYTVWIIVGIAAGVLVLAGLTVLIIILVKKRKKKQKVLN